MNKIMKRKARHSIPDSGAHRVVSPETGQAGRMTTPAAAEPAKEGWKLPFSPRLQGWLLGLLLGGLLIAAAVIRVYGARNDLWVDEIWSFALLREISSPWQVFTSIHHENNHYLNSLWLCLAGIHGNWPGYRIPSIVAGVGSVMLAGMIARRRNAGAAWLAMLVVAFSYVQILYSSEARGYSEVVFFAFLSFYALEKYFEKPGWRFALLFSISSILGFASHLIFLNFFCAAVLWSGWRFLQSGRGVGHALKALCACHAAPASFFIALYFVDIRRMTIGGGRRASWASTYADSLAWALGAPPGQYILWAASLLTVVLFIAGLWILLRERSDSWIFFAGVIVVIPILLAIGRNSGVNYVRHFLVGMSFFLILLSYVLAALYQRGWPGRILCLLLLAGYFAANAWHTISLFRYGRGQYVQAARYLAENTIGDVVTVGSNKDLATLLTLNLYMKEAMGNKRGEYYQRASWPQGGAEWFIYSKESFEEPTPPGIWFPDDDGNIFALVKSFQSAPLSGQHWFIFHNREK